MNYTVDVWNDGNIEDTILLDVDVEPDLAAFWSGWTNNTEITLAIIAEIIQRQWYWE